MRIKLMADQAHGGSSSWRIKLMADQAPNPAAVPAAQALLQQADPALNPQPNPAPVQVIFL
jgi:hypothetical protein